MGRFPKSTSKQAGFSSQNKIHWLLVISKGRYNVIYLLAGGGDVYLDDIKTIRLEKRTFVLYIREGGEHYAPALGPSDSFRRRAEFIVRARLYLHEYQFAAFLRYDIQFPLPCAIISRQYFIFMFTQKITGKLLASLAYGVFGHIKVLTRQKSF
jgi:hypothetical protein